MYHPRTIALIIISGAVLGFVSVILYRYFTVSKAKTPAPQSEQTLMPPSRSVTGTLAIANGEVTMRARLSLDFTTATPGASIYQGESVATGKGSAKLVFPDIGTVFLGNDAEIAALNIIPQQNVFHQKSGTVQFESSGSSPVAVRALNALCEITGAASINIEDSMLNIRVTKGAMTIALVDLNNNTRVWNVREGQSARIYDETRRVEIR